MSSFLEPDAGSPSMSKTEDNLSNSEGPLIKKNIRNHTSSTDVSGLKRSPSQSASQDPSSFDSEKKRYCLWTLTFILAMIGFSNLLLSITIISVLRVSQGMESLEIIPSENLVKFFGKTDLDRVCVEEGVCQGYGDEPMELTGDDSGVHLNVKNRRHDHSRGNLWVLKNGTTVSQIESFEIKDFRTGDPFFSTDFPNFGLPSGVLKLNVRVAQTHRIVSPINESLSVDSNREVTMHGAESLRLDSKQIVWMADNQVKLKSNDSIVVDAANGVFLDTKKIPIASGVVGSGSESYKICVCMPEGKLFRVLIPPGNVRVNCARVSMSADNPCL
ncbi:uncharacterized protein LOC123263566 [Cotesia glomerata]|uniref:Beta-sarcoglycan n=1 Tax=Cotesia glomerata TaxID=32391 RepID=A0AAV7IPP5_COTGL|nr:uncharacterized protein LOC123263566 [Cotesia glomerata]XP_044582385.1 uncharacterized protein LOC123263566 [Cotesia glomerata]KAH0554585.1 hypothetical protein KQX54_011667 [Cotesia glomerata]